MRLTGYRLIVGKYFIKPLREKRHRALLLGHQPFACGSEATGSAYADIDVCNRNSHRHVYLYDGNAARGVEAITL